MCKSSEILKYLTELRNNDKIIKVKARGIKIRGSATLTPRYDIICGNYLNNAKVLNEAKNHEEICVPDSTWWLKTLFDVRLLFHRLCGCCSNVRLISKLSCYLASMIIINRRYSNNPSRLWNSRRLVIFLWATLFSNRWLDN